MTSVQSGMTIEQFRASIGQEAAPEKLSPVLKAMWEDAKGNWSAAHSIAQEIEDETGSWIHAYLHRKEGDLGNAGYWYRRAKQPTANDTLEEEWTRIVSRLLRARSSSLDDK
jgi:hypothetical protein